MIPAYVITSNKSINCIKSLEHFYKFHGMDEVMDMTILGYDNPPFETDFSFESLGEDIGPNTDIGSLLIEFFRKKDHKYFTFTIDDFPPLSFDKELFSSSLSYFKNTKNAGRLGLTPDTKDRKHKFLEKVNNDTHIIESLQTVDYRISTIWSVWTKEYFLKHLKPGYTLWDWELCESKNDKYSVQSTLNNYVMDTAHLYKKGFLKKNWYKSPWTEKQFSQEEIDLFAINNWL